MKRFAGQPHDLRAICIACGITLTILSERTGIPEDELLRWAEGVHALCARDRFAIAEELCEWSSPVPPQAVDMASLRLARIAYLQIVREMRQEEAQEEILETLQNARTQ